MPLYPHTPSALETSVHLSSIFLRLYAVTAVVPVFPTISKTWSVLSVLISSLLFASYARLVMHAKAVKASANTADIILFIIL